MFEYRKYTLKFSKTRQYVDCINWKEVTDACLMSYLLQLQEKYDFKIVSVKFESAIRESYIQIKCRKEDRHKIFSEYCTTLDSRIGNVSF